MPRGPVTGSSEPLNRQECALVVELPGYLANPLNRLITTQSN